MRFSKKIYIKGFTLIELIVVVAVLSGVVGLFVSNSPASFTKARDTQRRNDLKQYATAIETYASKNNGLYPVETTTVNLTSLCATLGLPECPADPETPTYTYSYQSNATGTDYIVWGHLEASDVDWGGCSNGGVGELASTPTGGSCTLASVVSVPTPTPQPTLTPVPTATPTPPGAPTATPTPTPGAPTATPTPSQTNEPSISATPLFHWALNEGSGTFSSGTGSIGTSMNVNTATWTAGYWGDAGLSFSETVASVPDSNGFDFAGKNITVSLWFKADPTQVDSYPRFMDHYTGGASAAGWRFGFAQNAQQVIFFHEGSPYNVNLSTTEAMNDGVWHHALVTLPSSGTARLYIDGVEVDSDGFSGLIDRNQTLYVGAANSTGTSNSFIGELDDIRIYNEILSSVDIQTLAGN